MDRLLVAVVGPTGSGKSDLALEIAGAYDGEIVNCDSVQVYRYLDIGTAKTPPGGRRGIPHHMLDIAEPDELVTAGDYSAQARTILTEIASRGKLPVVAGGTGFYLRALLDGLFAGPRRDASLRKRLSDREGKRSGSLHRLLRRLDAASARRIHANDTNKLVRALEVCLLARRPLSVLHAEGREPLCGFRLLKIGVAPPREQLYARLDRRSRLMFENGLIEETQRILSLGYSPESKALLSLGYKEAVRVLRGGISVEEAIAQTQLGTRRYAKRQLTWFRREAGIEWLNGFGQDAGIQAAAKEKIAARIHSPAGDETFPRSLRI
ncbi:MAG: tRNA (adenosine(37)-N6)-dimethylallyltransferase MiaA [Bryobacteraceae bacterium]|nr:tRNA (adenosine(37)-N6)-dimethylallyltransferase MiaA [Bryobacteraceae bacterium]